MFARRNLDRPITVRLRVRSRVVEGVLLLAAIFLLARGAGAQPPSDQLRALFVLQAVPAAAPTSSGDVQAGTALFTGQRRFQNGGPACASCHSVATLPFPHGGTMAPDLTDEYSKLGPEGMHYALRTLYFPAMNALFLKRQLTDQEESDLTAFFQNADHVQRKNSHTGLFVGAAVGLLALIGITWVSGRGRVHSVRRKMLRRTGLYRESR